MSYSLESLITQSRQQLREFQPMYYKKLKASGELEAELKAVAQMALEGMADLRDAAWGQSQLPLDDEAEDSIFQDEDWIDLEMMDARPGRGSMD